MPLSRKRQSTSSDSVFIESPTDHTFVTIKQNLNSESLTDSIRKQRIYQACVSTASYYTKQKVADNSTWKGVLRELAGIPLAVLYGSFLVWIISNTILGTPYHQFRLIDVEESSLPKNVCEAALPTLRNGSDLLKLVKKDSSGQTSNIIGQMKQFDLPHKNLKNFNSSKKTSGKHDSHKFSMSNNVTDDSHMDEGAYCGAGSGLVFDNDCVQLYYSIGGVMCCISLASIFSRNIRATMLLLLPGLITRHSRHLIFTITLGILANGPIRNLQENFNKILDNTLCIYQSGMISACVKQMEVKEVLHYAENIHGELQNIKDSFNRIMCPYGNVDRLGRPCTGLPDYPFPFPNNSYDVLSTLSTSSSRGLRKHASLVMEKIIGLGFYGDIVRRCLTIISVIFLIVNAVRYLRYYHTDSSFDNLCVSGTTYRYWQTKGYYTSEHSLTYWNIEEGLRRWEQTQGFKMSIIPKLSKRESYKVLRNSFTTAAVAVLVLLVLFVDFVLAEALQYIMETEHKNSNMGNLFHNFTRSDHILRYQHKESCLSSATYTRSKDYLVICVLLSTAAISCILQVYLCGTRGYLCSLFYPERAEERADYLYYNIFTGRMNRRSELLLIVRREIERRQKLEKFSPLHRLLAYIKGLRNENGCSSVCPGCNKNCKTEEMKELSFHVVNKTIDTRICSFCHLDLYGEQRNRNVGAMHDYAT